MNKFVVNFNGVDMPDFLKVKAVNSSALPEISTTYKNVAGGQGVIESGTSIGGKTFSLDVAIMIPQGKTLAEVQRELAYWLKGNNFKLSPLVFSDDCEVQYMAKVNGQVNVSDLIFIGQGTIEFFVPSGTAENRFERHGAVEGNEIIIHYDGSADAFPIIEFTPSASHKKTVLRFTHIEKGTSVIMEGNFNAGEKITVDCNKKLVKVGQNLALSMLDLTSKWIKIQDRGINTIRCNLDGQLTCSYKERWL